MFGRDIAIVQTTTLNCGIAIKYEARWFVFGILIIRYCYIEVK